ncbi:MAG: hypothetical protein P4N59_22875 [Negativicutes bacterium]|nr:hypothetical protein [Negativicutes bacterium]
MLFSIECPKCKNGFQVRYTELAKDPAAVKCCQCGASPAPDIMTAYQNVGKTMTELYGCCECGDKESWLPKEIRR